jgi:hypothetical protein
MSKENTVVQKEVQSKREQRPQQAPQPQKKQQQHAKPANDNNQLSEREIRDQRRKVKEEKEQKWINKKVIEAQKKDTQVLQSQTEDTSELLGLIRSSDNFIYNARLLAGRKLTFEEVQDFIQRHEAIKQELHKINCEISNKLHWTYKPPRGFANPYDKAASGTK